MFATIPGLAGSDAIPCEAADQEHAAAEPPPCRPARPNGSEVRSPWLFADGARANPVCFVPRRVTAVIPAPDRDCRHAGGIASKYRARNPPYILYGYMTVAAGAVIQRVMVAAEMNRSLSRGTFGSTNTGAEDLTYSGFTRHISSRRLKAEAAWRRPWACSRGPFLLAFRRYRRVPLRYPRTCARSPPSR